MLQQGLLSFSAVSAVTYTIPKCHGIDFLAANRHFNMPLYLNKTQCCVPYPLSRLTLSPSIFRMDGFASLITSELNSKSSRFFAYPTPFNGVLWLLCIMFHLSCRFSCRSSHRSPCVLCQYDHSHLSCEILTLSSTHLQYFREC